MTGISTALRQQVQQRAGEPCEYCHLPESAGAYPFHIEHIIALKHGGGSETDNLAWACFQCNVSKGTDIASYDQETGELTPLFNPRTQQWEEHFEMSDGVIAGKTAVGRVTARLLQVNSAEQLALRRALLKAGMWEK